MPMSPPRWLRAFLAVFVLTSTLVVSTSLASQAEECPKRIKGTNDFDFSCMTEGEDPNGPGSWWDGWSGPDLRVHRGAQRVLRGHRCVLGQQPGGERPGLGRSGRFWPKA